MFSVNAVNACLSHDCPICSNLSLLFAPPLIRYMFCGMTGWSTLGNWNQSRLTTPALQEVVATPTETVPPTVPPVGSETAGSSPTITSGPGTVPTLGVCGITEDFTSPFTTFWTSIG